MVPTQWAYGEGLSVNVTARFTWLIFRQVKKMVGAGHLIKSGVRGRQLIVGSTTRGEGTLLFAGLLNAEY